MPLLVRLGLLPTLLTALILLAGTGCFDTATTCSAQQDCFLGERCIAGTCQAGGTTDNNTSTSCPAERPERCGSTCVERGRCAPDDCRISGCEGLTYCDDSDGICKPGCDADDDCPGSRTCDPISRLCSCDTGQRLCDGACRACPSDPAILETTCSDRACVAQACAPGTLLCGGACSPCPPDVDNVGCDAQGACVASMCEVNQLACNGVCATCPSGEGITATGCVDDRCVVSLCSQGYENCNGSCALCPQGGGILSTGCDDTRCVATSCADGFAPCDKDDGARACCPVMVQRLPPNGPIDAVARRDGATSSQDIGLVVDADGQPQVVYHRPVSRDLRYAVWDGTRWDITTVEASVGAGFNLSLAIDAQDTLHLAYQNQGDSRLYYRTKPKGAAWGAASVIDPAMGTGAAIDLALDTSGRPHVIYFAELNRSVRYATLNAQNSWVIEGITANVTLYFRPSLAFDNNQPRALLSIFDSTLRGPTLYVARPMGFGNGWSSFFLRRGAYRARLEGDPPNNAPVRAAYFQQTTRLNQAEPDDETLRYSFLGAGGLVNEQDVDTFAVRDLDTYNVALVSDVPAQQLTPALLYSGPLDASTSVVRFAERARDQWSITEVDKVDDDRAYLGLDHDAAGQAHAVYSGNFSVMYWRSQP